MGNSSARQGLMTRRLGGYGSIGDDTASVNSNNVDLLDFLPKTRRRVALVAILICQLFDLATFTALTVWIPQTLRLNVFFFSANATTNDDEFHNYMKRVQMIPVLGMLLICSCSWIAGICMDSCFKKTSCTLVTILLASVGSSFIVAVIVGLAKNVSCTIPYVNGTFSCSISVFELCPASEKAGGYCLNVYIGCICAVSVLSSVLRTTLPALGGDQIPERRGVRTFYAQFYWFTKAGEALATFMAFCYLLAWKSYQSRSPNPENYVQYDYMFILYGWGVFVAVTSFLSLLALIVVVCGKITREVHPDISVIKDTCRIWYQGFKRRRDRLEDDSSCLEVAKCSRGGWFPDDAVNERIQLSKFFLVLLLLVPVAFGATLPLLPGNSIVTNSTRARRLEAVYEESHVTTVLNLIRFCTAIFVIPIVHRISISMEECGRSLTFLHRFVSGHVVMILAIAVSMIAKLYRVEYTIENFIGPMVLLGICNALIYTAGYELTMISAPRAMQGTAMGMFYLIDSMANLINFLLQIYVINANETNTDDSDYYIINGVGGVACMSIATVLLILAEKKFDLGLSRT